MSVALRRLAREDAPAVRRLLWDTWLDAYARFVPQADLQSYFDAHYTEAQLAALSEDPDVSGFVAEADGRIAGYVKVFFNRNEQRIYVHQIYILPAFQGTGVGRRLMIRAANCAAERGFDRVWLGVMVKNEPAFAWYSKMGFVVTETAPFTMGSTTVDHHIGYVPLDAIFAVPARRLFTPSARRPLHEQAVELFEQQRTSWPMLANGCASLESAQLKQLDCRGFRAYLQYNPKRIVSTGAKVDAKSIQARPCFLCVENLPAAQLGILYRGQYLILCNPAPIFPRHLTIPNIRHTPQALEPHIDAMFALAEDLSPAFSLFYNGPRCGASAPDHMHFQASPYGSIPVERDLDEGSVKGKRESVGGVELLTPESYGREMIVLQSGDAASVKRMTLKLLSALRTVMQTPEEPMVNVICSKMHEKYRVIAFLRSKHRPDAFFREGEQKITISPAAADIGGIVVTPFEHDFLNVDAAMLESIYAEVSVDRAVTARVTDLLRR